MRKKSSQTAANGNGVGANGDSADAGPATPTPESVIVDLNSATTDELRQLRGIGPALAERILQYRATNGPFMAPAGLLDVPGISQATYDAIAGSITARMPDIAAHSSDDRAAAESAPPPVENPAQPLEAGPASQALETGEDEHPATPTTAAVAAANQPLASQGPAVDLAEAESADNNDLAMTPIPLPAQDSAVVPATAIVPAAPAPAAPEPSPAPVAVVTPMPVVIPPSAPVAPPAICRRTAATVRRCAARPPPLPPLPARRWPPRLRTARPATPPASGAGAAGGQTSRPSESRWPPRPRTAPAGTAKW